LAPAADLAAQARRFASNPPVFSADHPLLMSQFCDAAPGFDPHEFADSAGAAATSRRKCRSCTYCDVIPRLDPTDLADRVGVA